MLSRAPGRYTAQPATEQFEQQVAGLFSAVQLPIHQPHWARAYSPQNPTGFASRPLVATGSDGQVAAFIAARPARIHFQTSFDDALILHDIALKPAHDSAQQTLTVLRDALLEMAPTLIAAGVPLGLAPLMEDIGFRPAGYFRRYFLPPGKSPSIVRDLTQPFDLEQATEFSPALEDLNHALVQEHRFFRLRMPIEMNWLVFGPAPGAELFISREYSGMDAYAVLRETPGKKGKELHVIDLVCRANEARRMALGLRELARERHRPLFVHAFCETWRSAFDESGFTPLRPRWPVYVYQKPIMTTKASFSPTDTYSWLFTPLDGEIDHWL